MGWPKRSSGGVRQWVLTMANALVDRGYRVDVLSEAPAERFIDEPLLDARVGRVVLGRKGWTARRALGRYVQAHAGVRVVAALDYYNLRAAALKRRFGDRVQVMVTQRENLSADAAWRAPLKYWLITRAVRRLFNQADHVVAVSQGLADDLHDNFGVHRERLHAIYNPAYRPQWLQAADEPVDHPFYRNRTAPVFVAAGRLHFVKGFDVLLRAFARLRAERDARLVILGEGKERARLEALVEELGLADAVSLPGRKPNLASWFRQADAFVLSSRREGLPAVLIEALAVGARVIATRCPSGPDEILENGRWGRLVEVGDVGDLHTAMRESLDLGPPDREPLQARAAEFSLERALARYLELWRQPPRPAG